MTPEDTNTNSVMNETFAYKRFLEDIRSGRVYTWITPSAPVKTALPAKPRLLDKRGRLIKELD